MTPVELHIFDFDGTLFRSPEQPTGWKSNGGPKNWWQNQDSLGRPCVPDQPDSSWWVSSILSVAKESAERPDVLAALVTGRSEMSFARWRVPELLGQQGIDFDQVYLHPGGVPSTAMFKQWVVMNILRRYPEITVVRVWDDTRSNLESMGLGVDARTYVPTLVKSTPKEVSCPTEPSEQAPDFLRVAARWG
jgi:hypothetical protein